eukprot:scaffold357333_cov24-Prasinocladus_malaysianus.AAC.2
MAEVVKGLKALIRNPDITPKALRRHIPAPDFPTGGCLLEGQGLLDAYETGRGSFTLRGRVAVEAEGSGGSGKGKGGRRSRGGERALIVISEIPYQTNKADLVEKIAELVDSRIIENVSGAYLYPLPSRLVQYGLFIDAHRSPPTRSVLQ